MSAEYPLVITRSPELTIKESEASCFYNSLTFQNATSNFFCNCYRWVEHKLKSVEYVCENEAAAVDKIAALKAEFTKDVATIKVTGIHWPDGVDNDIYPTTETETQSMICANITSSPLSEEATGAWSVVCDSDIPTYSITYDSGSVS